MLCSSIVQIAPAVIYGAASIRLPVQNPFPTTCDPITTSINEFSLFHNFEINPNPATNEIEIRNLEFKNYKITIYDITGKKVFQTQNSNLKSQIDIDISGMNMGIYLLQIQTADFIQSKKLVIAR